MDQTGDYSLRVGDESWLMVGGLDEVKEGLAKCSGILISARDITVRPISAEIRPQYDDQSSHFIVGEVAKNIFQRASESLLGYFSWGAPAAAVLGSGDLTIPNVVADILNRDLDAAEKQIVTNLSYAEYFLAADKEMPENDEKELIQDFSAQVNDLNAVLNTIGGFDSLKKVYRDAAVNHLEGKRVVITPEITADVDRQVTEKVTRFFDEIKEQIAVTQQSINKRLKELSPQEEIPMQLNAEPQPQLIIVRENVLPAAPAALLQEASKIVENAEILAEIKPDRPEPLYRDLTGGERRVTFPKFLFNGESLKGILDNLSFEGCYALMRYTDGFVLESRGKGRPLPLKDPCVKLLSGTQINGKSLLNALVDMDSAKRELMGRFIAAHYEELRRQRES